MTYNVFSGTLNPTHLLTYVQNRRRQHGGEYEHGTANGVGAEVWRGVGWSVGRFDL